MTEEEKRNKFIEATGIEPDPEYDDLERAFCEKAGQCGHYQCGWCVKCNEPTFSCECAMSGN